MFNTFKITVTVVYDHHCYREGEGTLDLRSADSIFKELKMRCEDYVNTVWGKKYYQLSLEDKADFDRYAKFFGEDGSNRVPNEWEFCGSYDSWVEVCPLTFTVRVYIPEGKREGNTLEKFTF